MIYRLPVLGYRTKIVQQIWYKAVRHTLCSVALGYAVTAGIC